MDKINPMEIETIPVDIVALLGGVELPYESYAELEIGDILLLDQPIDSPLHLTVSGESALTGLPVQLNAKKAIKIQEGP